jgi:uncharacterized protein (TIGR02145 family)
MLKMPNSKQLRAGYSLFRLCTKKNINKLKRITKMRNKKAKLSAVLLLGLGMTGLQAQVTDIDGNVYKTIKVGTQTWIKENLKTTKYSDGTAIPNVKDNAVWTQLYTGAYCWYNNDAATNKVVYGALYNWYAVSATSNGGKNVCPTGWHVPSDAEWTALENYLIANDYNYDGTTNGDRSTNNKIAKSLAATIKWNSFNRIGIIGNTDYPTYIWNDLSNCTQ